MSKRNREDMVKRIVISNIPDITDITKRYEVMELYETVLFTSSRKLSARFRRYGVFNKLENGYSTYSSRIISDYYMDVYNLDIPIVRRQVRVIVM